MLKFKLIEYQFRESLEASGFFNLQYLIDYFFILDPLIYKRQVSNFTILHVIGYVKIEFYV